MKITVSNDILIEEPTQDILTWCKTDLVVDNPEYTKKQRMGLWLGNTPQKISLYEKDGANIRVPFGCIEKLWSDHKNDAKFTSNIGEKKNFAYTCDAQLYDYQEEAVNAAMQAKNGIIVMPCGAGKTRTALCLIARLGLKTLWLTHTQDLLNQSMSSAASLYGDTLGFGKITGGKVDIGASITFATVQTMSKLDLTKYRNEWSCVVVDECHKAVGSPTKVMQFYKVLSNLSCRYKYGITATPKRADGLEVAMFSLIGGIAYEVTKDDVKENTCDVAYVFQQTGYKPNFDIVLAGDGTINYAALVDDLVGNEERFNFVLKTISEYKFRGAMIVLANRVDYLARLHEAYDGRSVCLSGMRNTKANKQIRKNALNDLNSGKIDCIFATYQLAKEGLDVPNLRTVVFATPEKDETTVIQSAGRVGRKHEGKKYGLIVDFVDDFGMLSGWKRRRKKIYEKLNFIDMNGFYLNVL